MNLRFANKDGEPMRKESPNDSFSIFPTHYFSHIHFFRKILIWIRKRKFSFSTAVLLSSLSHVTIIVLLCLSQTSSLSTKVFTEKDYKAFWRASAEIREDILDKEKFEMFFSEMTQDKIMKLITEGGFYDLNLGEKQKVEFYKTLIKEYFRLTENKVRINPDAKITLKDILAYLSEKGEFELSSGDKVYSWDPFPGREKPRFYALPKDKKDKIEHLKRLESIEKDYVEIYKDQVKVKVGKGFKLIPIEYYFRDSPFEEILARGSDLFYIVRGFPSSGERLSSEQTEEKIYTSPFAGYKKDFIVILLKSSLLKPEKPSESSQQLQKALQISPEETVKLLDDLMALSEEEQFLYFKVNYLEKYNPDDRYLARLTREFLHSNLSNVIIHNVPISVAFTFIEELFFNKPLDSYLPVFWRENPNTKTGAELLLCLAALYDFEKRGLDYLFSTYEEAKTLLSKKYYIPNVFYKKLKAFIIKEVYDELTVELGKRGYTSVDDVLNKYTEEQMKIYRMIIRMGGEERNKALFALGRLYWDEGNYELALEKWKEIDDSYYSKTFQDIKKALGIHDDLQRMITEINSIINFESRMNSSYQLKRLLKYHRWKKRGEKIGTQRENTLFQ